MDFTEESLHGLPQEIWLRLWNRSVYLSSAYVDYADEKSRKQYNRLYLVGGPPAQGRNFTKASKDPALAFPPELRDSTPTTGMGTIAAILGGMAHIHQNARPARADEYEALRDGLRKQCQIWLRDRKLIAVGYSKDRKPGDLPQPVPQDLIFRGVYDWASNKIHHSTLKMVDVRLGPPSVLRDLAKNSGSTGVPAPNTPEIPPELPEPKQLGRPTKKGLLWEAYIACVDAGLIDFARKRHAHDVVMSWIRENYPDQYENGQGLGFETFRKLTNDDWQKRTEIPERQ